MRIVITGVAAILILMPLAGHAEVSVTTPDLKSILPGPATGIFELLDALKTEVNAKMSVLGPKFETSIEGVKNALQTETGINSIDSIGGAKSWVEKKTAYFQTDEFIARASGWLGNALRKIIEMARGLVSAL